MEDTGYKRRVVRYQYFAAIAANLITLSFGSGVGWLSPALPSLESNQTSLETGPLNDIEIATMGSIVAIGSIVGNLITGGLVTYFGSKTAILALGIPQLVSWGLLIFGFQSIHLIASRFVIGMVGGGAQAAISIYVAEIADNHIRGQVAIIYQFNRRFGVLIAVVFVACLNYVALGMFYIGITILFYCLFLLLPPTPQYLFQNNHIDRAEKSLRFYKGYQNRKNSLSYITEVEHLKTVSKAIDLEPSFKFKYLLEAKALRAILQAFMIPLLGELTGAYTFLTYGSKIIKESGTQVNTGTATILMGVAQLVGTIFASILVDKKGRRFLLSISLAGCLLSHAVLILFLEMHKHGLDLEVLHWMPVACLTSAVLCASSGIVPLALICLVESFPMKLRSFGVTFGTVCLNLCTFAVVFLYQFLEKWIYIQGCIIVFCTSSLLGLIYIIMFVEETRGKDLNVVDNENEDTASHGVPAHVKEKP